MIRYAATIFLSAFLLFQVQPMIAKYILPWYGGTSVVWTTCMMYFQTVLLLGYLYSHLVRKTLSPRAIWLVHLTLLAAAAFMLKTEPPAYLRPVGGENLTWAIVKLLTVTVGLPFFALSTTGPLVQAWHSLSHGGKTYRLYAISNLGSILALVSYPFIFERVFPLGKQTLIWVIAFIGFAAVCAWSGWQTIGFKDWNQTNHSTDSTKSSQAKSPGIGAILLWLTLSMAPSIMLLATTNLMCSEVASVPFLWILPLGLYLISLIICFDRPSMYKRRVFTPFLLLSAMAAVLVVQLHNKLELLPQIIGLASVCFACSMTCHGELERLKPAAENLTLFYLVMSVGGALGGIFVVVVAPMLFDDYFEFHIGLLASLVVPISIQIYSANKRSDSKVGRLYVLGFTGLVVATCVGCSLYYFADPGQQPGLLERSRNEYGLASVKQREGYRIMVNGRTEHGGQHMDPERAFEPSGYYLDGCGVSVAVKSYRQSLNPGAKLKIGVIGLGTGSMVVWGKPSDSFTFYEINPEVEMLARKYFTYLDDWPGPVDVILGDGRIQLERQMRESGSQQFDLIFMDAFTSDSIPAHLLTDECFDLYKGHLRPGGVLVAHISNRFVDLRPVVHQLATSHHLTPILIDHQYDDQQGATRWVLMTDNPMVLRSELVKNASVPWPSEMPTIKWTDDFASLSQLIDWSIGIDWDSIRRGIEEHQKNQQTSQ